MKIGLIDVDGFGTRRNSGGSIYPNLALCKIAAYHKSLGDSVEWYDMFSGHMDIVYMSKIFIFTPDYPYSIDADEVVRGGTGYDVKVCLPKYVDDMQPDFSIYPSWDGKTSYGFLSRGCPNKCQWCIVPMKEGKVHPYWDIERVANGRKYLVLMDNNILGDKEYAIKQLTKAISNGYHIDFNQAIDARLVDDEVAQILASVHWIHSRIRFGCDTTAQIKHCDKAMELICKYGYKGEFFLYTMIHGDFHECYERINHFKKKHYSQNRTLVDHVIHTHSHIETCATHHTSHHNGRETWLGGVTKSRHFALRNSLILSREKDSNVNGI